MKGVLLYQLSREKLLKIKVILLRLGLAAREVRPEEYGLPLGVLAGVDGFEPDGTAETEGTPFTGEMLVMCGLSSMQFSSFLNALRENRCSVPLKAVLTETNAGWSSNRLHRELAAEHAALQKVKPKDAGKKSRHHT